MRSWRRWLAAAVLLLLAAVALAPASEPGTRLLLAMLDRHPAVTIEGVQGRVLGALRVERLALALPVLDLSITALRADHRPGCLLRGTLCLDQLRADTVTVDWLPGEGRDGTVPPLPFPLRVAELSVTTLRLLVAGSEIELDAVRLAVFEAAGRQLDAEEVELRYPPAGRVAGRASLRLDSGLPLTATGVYRPAPALRTPLSAHVALDDTVAFALSGPVAALAIEARTAASVDAAGGTVAARGRATLDWPTLELASLRLALPEGALEASGSLELPSLSGQLAVRAEGVAVPALTASTVAPVSGTARVALAGRASPGLEVTALRLQSRVGDRSLDIAGRGGWRPGLPLPVLDLTGSLGNIGWRIEGGGGRPVAYRARSADGAAWGPLRSGALALDGALAADASGFSADWEVEELHGGAWAISTAAGRARVDLGARRVIDASAELDGLATAGYRLERLRLTGAGDATAFTLRAGLHGDVDGELDLAAERRGDDWRLAVAPLTLQTPLGTLALPERVDATLLSAAGRLDFPAHCWSLDTLSLCLDAGSAGEQGALAGNFAGGLTLPPEALGVLTEASAETRGRFQLRYGGGEPPRASARSRVDAITLRPRRGEAPLPSPGVLELAFELKDTLTVSGALRGGALGAVDVDAEQASGDWQGTVTVAAAPLDYFQPLAPALARLEGTVSGEVSLSSSAPGLLAGGSLAVADGVLALRASDAVLEDLALELSPGADGRLAVAGEGRLGGGPVRLQGHVDPAGPRLDLAVTGDRNAVHWPGLLEATVSPDMRVTLVGGAPALAGELRVHGGKLSPGQVGAGGVEVSADATIVGEESVDAAEGLGRIDLRILVDNGFRVTGEFVDAVVGGDLRLEHDPGTPLQLFGRVKVIAGELRAYGQRLALKEGSMGFVGDPRNPELALRAERDFPAESLRVGFTVDGSLEEPRLAIYSDPQLPRDAELSWLLRGRPPDAGASLDGTALALSLGATALNQSELMRSLNSLPLLSNVSLGTETGSAGTAATISGYVGERLYLSYGLGLYEPVNTLTARLYLRARLWLEVVSELENSIDLYYRFDID